MKKLLSLALTAFMAVSIFSCKKAKIETDLESKISITFDIPVDTVPGLKEYNKQIVNSNLEQTLKDNGGSLDDVKSVLIKSVDWELIDGSTMTFDAIDYVDSYFSLDGSSETKVAYLNPVPHDGRKSISLSSSNIDVRSILSSKTIYVVSKGYNNQKVLTPQPVKVTVYFKIKASIAPKKSGLFK